MFLFDNSMLPKDKKYYFNYCCLVYMHLVSLYLDYLIFLFIYLFAA